MVRQHVGDMGGVQHYILYTEYVWSVDSIVDTQIAGARENNGVGRMPISKRRLGSDRARVGTT